MTNSIRLRGHLSSVTINEKYLLEHKRFSQKAEEYIYAGAVAYSKHFFI